MKAILRWGAALLSLLLLTSVSHGYYWVSAALRTPLPHAPDARGSGYYSMNAYGQWTGPHYYLRPPMAPFGGMLPGPTGQAIMSGNLPHTLLLSKQGMDMGNAPLLGAKQQQQQQQQAPHHGAPPQQQQAMGPAPMLGSPAMQQYGMMQLPHAAMATGQYAMPYGMPTQTQAPMGYGQRPMMWAPYQAQQQQQPMPYQMQQPQPQPGPQAVYWRGSNGIWQVQNAPAPNGGPMPFSTIPGYKPGMPPGPGFQPGQPMPMPPQGIGMVPPNMGNGPGYNPMPQFNPMQQFGPMQQFDPLSRMQPAQPNMSQMQLPRMDPMPPQMPNVGGSAYPVHPFTRSPRDFFMWGESMEDERARANRPFPVP